jgi:hypothetical protein
MPPQIGQTQHAVSVQREPGQWRVTGYRGIGHYWRATGQWQIRSLHRLQDLPFPPDATVEANWRPPGILVGRPPEPPTPFRRKLRTG